MPPPAGDVGPSSSIRLADSARLAALDRSALLDSDAEEAFERLTRIATSMLGVPVSLVSLVAADRQFFKSASGLSEPWASRRGSPLSHSFCQHVVTRAAPLVIEDARHDPLLQTNAAIDDLGVVAYAGYPIRSSEGEVIGSLCAIDHVPRIWTPRELALLEDLASLAHTELVLRASARTAHAVARDAERMFAERQAVIESTSDGIYTTDLAGRCTFANAAVIRLLGYPTEALIGQDMHALLHHHDGDGALLSRDDCALAVALERGLPARMNDTVFMRHDGSTLPVEVTFSPLFRDGALDGAVVTFRDISERLAAAAVLHESETKFRAVFEDAGIGIVISALDGRLLDCNAAYVLLTGYTREELLATSFEIVTDPVDAIEQRRLADEMLAGRQAQLRMEKRYVRKDGEIVWGRLTATLMRDAAGAPRFLVGAVEDITLQRRAAQAMRLLADAGAMLAGSLVYETRLEEVARRALPTLGEACILELTASGAARQSVRVHRDPIMEAALRALGEIPLPSGGVASEDERRSLLLDLRALAEAESGPWTNLAALGLSTMIVLPIRGRTGTLGWLGFLSAQPRYADEDVRLAEELAARAASAIDNATLYRSAQSATRLRDEVLAVVSHDLRNPVHTITMGASVLLELPALDQETIRQQLGVIRRSAVRANQLISDLLDVTRIENGHLRLERELVPVRELLADAAQLVASRADERRITVSVAAPSDEALADVDRHRVLQALDNLLGNALKFTPPGGAVALSARADEHGTQFTVHDSGPGIPDDERPHLFQRFWQAHRGDRRGVGLGLSIVKGIVDAHGGAIEVGAEHTAGTSIRFTIPRRGLDTEAVA
jgi:PAS domain S-box-containing protein